MVSFRFIAVFGVLSLVAALSAAGGLLFIVQPGVAGGRAGAAAAGSACLVEQQRVGVLQSEEASTVTTNSSFAPAGLLFGLALGLVVGFAGASAARAEGAAYTPSVSTAWDVFDLRTAPDGPEAEQQWKAWNKAAAAKYNVRQFTPEQDKKYAESAAGSGTYAKYGYDFASPIMDIPRGDAGKYGPEYGPFQICDGGIEDPDLAKRFEPFLKKKAGNPYSNKSPYEWRGP